MNSKIIRDKYIKFFIDKGHKQIPSAKLVPENDPSVLFTTAGMQPLKSYFAGNKDPMGDFSNKNLVSVQKCFRTSDIDSVGDESHLTFFEMLGNFSIGGYGKKEAISYAWELMTSKAWYGLPRDRFFATVFAGDDEISADQQSEEFWKKIAPNIEVKKFGRKENFWPNPVWVGTCGPSSELHYVLDDRSSIEVWNLVFTQYFHNEDGSFKDLGQVNIDTGMGLERLAMISQGKSSVFETDLFMPIIKEIEKVYGNPYKGHEKSMRIISDHLKAVTFIISDGVEPGKKEQGSILRRLIRRAYDNIHGKYNPSYNTTTTSSDQNWKIFEGAIKQIIDIYSKEGSYQYLLEKQDYILSTVKQEVDSYQNLVTTTTTTLPPEKQISGKIAFELYSTHGFSPTQLRSQGYVFDQDEYDEELKKHQEISRAGAGKFAGGLAGHSETEIKYHTATHLLHQALRDVLGPEVFQKGSNITIERLRFDFSFDRKMTNNEIKAVEDLVNQKIKEDLKVDHMIIPLDEAKKMNAIGLFDEKYADKVSIYGVGPRYKDSGAKDQRNRGGYYSLEFCGGPHVEHTGEIGAIKITKEEAIASGIRRIRAKIVLR